MAFPFGSRSIPPGGAAPTRPKSGPVVAIGSRAIVTRAAGGVEPVTLTDHKGTSAVLTLRPGAEVEIVAWQPHRASGTRYRVRATDGAGEGWLEGSSLTPIVLPPTPKKPPVAVAPPARKRTATRSTATTRTAAPAKKASSPAAETRKR